MIGETVSHYRIRASLGGGGMGVVYEAEDTRLHRSVAVKFVTDEAAVKPAAIQRFRREAEAASALSHPHICTIFDVGEHAGRPFIVMERLQGQTLSLLISGRPLPLDRTLTLASEVADALAAAHAAGIIHRDVKPANIFVTTRGDAKLLDFGPARLDPSHDGPASPDDETEGQQEDLTNPGTTLGTLAYMSPEQARGETIDARSDLFSFGAVLYEMATGQAPFRGATSAVICDAILNRQVARPSLLNAEIPAELDQLILGLLEKDRDLRAQSATEVRAALRRLRRDTSSSGNLAAQPRAHATHRRLLPIAAGVATLLVVLAAWFATHRTATSAQSVPAVPAEKRIAVLPFENLGSAENNYFADGMTDEVRGKLASLPHVAVIARASCDQYKGTHKSPREIANELGVNYLLTGRIRWQGVAGSSRIRLSPELSEIPGEGPPVTRWQNAYDADLSDVFQVQEQVATAVARSLEVALGAKETKQLGERSTSNVEAYQADLKGRAILARGENAALMGEAAAEFQRAVALDPSYALSWAHLAVCDSLRYRFSRNPEFERSARAAAEKAMALSPRMPEAYVAMAAFYRHVTGDDAQALASLRRGLSIAPHHVDLIRNLGYTLMSGGQLDEALAAFRQAVALDPRVWENYAAVSEIFYYLRRSGDSRQFADRGLAVNPTNLTLVYLKAISYLQEGDLSKARAVVAAAPKEIEATALVAYFADAICSYLLDSQQRDLLLRLTPASYDNNRQRWALTIANEYHLRGNVAETMKYAEELRKACEEQVRLRPMNATAHQDYAWSLALLGRRSEAVREGKRAVELAKNTLVPLLALSWIVAQTGNQEEAIDIVEQLLRLPTGVTPGELRVVPWYDPLRGNPRFDRLARGQETRTGATTPAEESGSQR